jgi:hypothetical protein
MSVLKLIKPKIYTNPLLTSRIILYAWVLRLSDKSFMDNSQIIALLFLTLYTAAYYSTIPLPIGKIVSCFKSVWFYFIAGTILIILVITPIPMSISYVVCYICICVFMGYYIMEESMNTIEILRNMDARYKFDVKKVWDALVFMSLFMLLITTEDELRLLRVSFVVLIAT